MYGFGYNGFGQFNCFISDEDPKDDYEVILTPCKLQLNISNQRQSQLTQDTDSFSKVKDADSPIDQREIDNVDDNCEKRSNIEKCLSCCKCLSLSWDSSLWKSGNGRWHIPGFHSSLNSSIKEDIKIQSGCLSWDSIVLVNHEGDILLKEFNKGDSSWHKIKLSKENRASVDLDDAQCIRHAVSGGKHVFAITDSQRVACVRREGEGEIILRPLGLNVAVKAVSCGKEHTLLLSRIGTVFSCGIGGQGQLGHGDIENVNEPRVIEALEGVSMVTVAAGGWHSVAVSDIGDIYIWGWNERGQLGFPSKSVQEDTEKESPEGTSSREHQSEKQYQSERPSSDDYVNILAQPALLELLDDSGSELTMSKVSCGSRHTAAITDAGQLYTWGWNKYGQLGHGTVSARDRPVLVRYFSERRLTVSDVVCGPWSTVVCTQMTDDIT